MTTRRLRKTTSKSVLAPRHVYVYSLLCLFTQRPHPHHPLSSLVVHSAPNATNSAKIHATTHAHAFASNPSPTNIATVAHVATVPSHALASPRLATRTATLIRIVDETLDREPRGVDRAPHQPPRLEAVEEGGEGDDEDDAAHVLPRAQRGDIVAK